MDTSLEDRVRIQGAAAESVYHSRRALVQCAECQSLQIFALGMMQAHRVIDGSTKVPENRELAATVNRRAEDDFLKKFGRQMLRTRKRQQYAARIQMSERVQIQKFVAARGGIEIAPSMRQRGWIKDD